MNRYTIKIIDIIKNHWHDFKKYKGNRLPKDIRNDIYESGKKQFIVEILISHKLLSDIKKVNIPKGHKKIVSALSKMFKSEKEVLFG